MSTSLLVHLIGIGGPVVALIQTFGSARNAGDAWKTFLDLSEIGRIGSISCIFVATTLFSDLLSQIAMAI